MSSTPTAQQNPSLPNTPSFDPSNNISPSAPKTFSYPSQPHSDPPSTSNSANTSRFNSFSLPAYRNLHSGASDVAAQSSSSLAHNPFSASSNPSVADQSSRHHSLSSTPSNYQQQQQQHNTSRLLSSTSTTPSSSSFAGSAAKPAGGGGGSGSSGSGVPNLSLGQIHLLIATINERNYETKLKEIQRVSFLLGLTVHRALCRGFGVLTRIGH